MAKLDSKLLEEVKRMREQSELHELYGKHVVPEGDRLKDPDVLDYSTRICTGCGMPVDSDGHTSAAALDAFYESSKKLHHPAAYILAMERWLAGKFASERYVDPFLTIDTMTLRYKDYFDHDQMRAKFIAATNEEAGGQRGSWEALVRYEECVLGKVAAETKTRLLEKAEGETGAVKSGLYLALMLRHNWHVDRGTLRELIRRNLDTQLKQMALTKAGLFRAAVLRGTRTEESLSSYFYCKATKPAVLKDPEWTARKLRFDKHGVNRLTHLRYYIDYGLGLNHDMLEDNPLMAAIARFIPDKYPANAAVIAKWREDQLASKHRGYKFVFGTDTDRRECYGVDQEYHLINLSTDIEMFFHYILPDYVRNKTDNPVNRLLDPEEITSEGD